MDREGWVYSQQEGSSYVFKKDGREEIVTTQQWDHCGLDCYLDNIMAELM
ncbi:hypothetical protein [Paenibacillus tundrae]|nr:hypothetical protein [Paenibacillus tundrae]